MVFAFLPRAYSDQFTVVGFNIDDEGQVNYRSQIEFAQTNDTVTSSESGKVFAINSAGGGTTVIMTLPDAAEGLHYTFVADSAEAFQVDTNGTDTFQYASLAAGQRISNTSAAKGDSITFAATNDSVWQTMPLVGTWAAVGGT